MLDQFGTDSHFFTADIEDRAIVDRLQKLICLRRFHKIGLHVYIYNIFATDLSFFFQGSYGNKIFNFLQQKLELTTVNLNAAGNLVDRYSATNPDGKMPRATNAPVSQVADIYIEDGSFLRLKNLTLGYTLPKELISKIHLKQLRFYVGAQNIWTLTNYTGLDPEVNFFDTDNTKQGIDYGAYPSNKTFLAGLNISF